MAKHFAVGTRVVGRIFPSILVKDGRVDVRVQYRQFLFGKTKWRTTPLIGLGVRTRYLHDGRATTLRDAIVAHGGEGEIVRDRFLRLSPAEQAAAYRFLESL